MNFLVSYVQGTLAELRKVSWPTMPVVVTYFFSVVIGVGVAAAAIFAMDYVFIQAVTFIIS